MDSYGGFPPAANIPGRVLLDPDDLSNVLLCDNAEAAIRKLRELAEKGAESLATATMQETMGTPQKFLVQPCGEMIMMETPAGSNAAQQMFRVVD